MNDHRRCLWGLMLLVGLTLSACDLWTGDAAKAPVVPLPTYATGRPIVTRQPTVTSDPNFWSNGSYIQGWWWVRDDAYQQNANWIVDIPAGTQDVILKLEVLATTKANGGRGASAVFFLSYGLPPAGSATGVNYGRKQVELPNTSPTSDPVGYTCTGTITLTRAEIQGARRLWIKATRKDDLGEFPPSTVHVAFNKQSVQVGKQ